MKVVITGGCGFIGSHIVEYWISRNADVHIIDNLRSGYKKNIEIFDQTNITLREGSITDKSLVDEALKDADYVFNLAALVSVPESMDKPKETIDINVGGLLNLLEAGKNNGIKKLVHSSSAAVYGDDPELPKITKMRPNPKSPYGITKLDGEYYCQMFTEAYGVKTVSLRYFNAFGPRQDPKSMYAAAIPIFISKAVKNEDITIYGDGEQTRDFVYVKDIVKANLLAAENPNVTGVFNVAQGKSITIKKLAEWIIEIIGSQSKINFEDERAGDIKHSLASIVNTVEQLKFQPEYDLKTGLEKTIEFFTNKN